MKLEEQEVIISARANSLLKDVKNSIFNRMIKGNSSGSFKVNFVNENVLKHFLFQEGIQEEFKSKGWELEIDVSNIDKNFIYISWKSPDYSKLFNPNFKTVDY